MCRPRFVLIGKIICDNLENNYYDYTEENMRMLKLKH